ncbi:hypothetical protein [Acaryochloris sp. IP29b_bin.137]|uniref:hypothetical protein n=1 Tax=Acaryochloris sp. IP29b_bin.137 TaxID=2969217 RepID=UPI00262C3524|nr:hypothetical protein [Acaryochloris sp. IP29b_bin.137]
MSHSLRTLSITLAVASSIGCAGFLSPNRANALPTNSTSTASAKYTYSPHLVRLYTYECTKKLQEAEEEMADQATEICQCSISQMQQHHPQMQAIRIFTKAQASIKSDPKAMPPELSPYFTPCISKRG